MPSRPQLAFRRTAQVVLLCFVIFIFLGTGDENARFNDLGHRLMCVCGCNQVLLECNHVGCSYSDHMRQELIAATERGNNDSMVLQTFVQEYGTTVLAAPTDTGFNRFAWVIPYLVLVLGLGVVSMFIRAWERKLVGRGQGHRRPDPALECFRSQAQQETDI